MACHCHGKEGIEAVEPKPLDQCTVCAKKHIDKAHALWSEFLYTQANRRQIHGQLRLAVDHLMYDHRLTAILARDVAQKIELNRDAELKDAWERLAEAVDADFYADHPDALERLNRLQASKETLS